MIGRNRLPETAGVFAVGIAVGAALGLLFAPRSGEETRDYIADTARESFEGAVSRGRKFARQARSGAAQAREQLEEAADAGARAFDQAKRA
jgi:gas vesicle protein